jgi:hypothetical protein
VALFEPFFDALNQAHVRYVVVGGFAVVLHGFARLTGDVDLAIDLDPAAARHTIDTFVALGLRPRAPVDPYAFADAATRREWAVERHMRVFSLWDPDNPMREVDVFVENPISFEELWHRSEVIVLAATTVRVASIPDLIAMKRAANRPQDRLDIEGLEALARRRS